MSTTKPTAAESAKIVRAIAENASLRWFHGNEERHWAVGVNELPDGDVDAALHAAAEALDRRDGLLDFGPPDASGTRHAVAKDGEHYKLFCPHLRRWHWSKDIGTTRPDDETDGSADTEAEAEAAAVAHDKARRGGK